MATGDTGFVSVPYLLDVLDAAGRHDLALKTLVPTQSHPGSTWLRTGATPNLGKLGSCFYRHGTVDDFFVQSLCFGLHRRLELSHHRRHRAGCPGIRKAASSLTSIAD
jgi:hypothetical protein